MSVWDVNEYAGAVTRPSNRYDGTTDSVLVALMKNVSTAFMMPVISWSLTLIEEVSADELLRDIWLLEPPDIMLPTLRRCLSLNSTSNTPTIIGLAPPATRPS